MTKPTGRVDFEDDSTGPDLARAEPRWHSIGHANAGGGAAVLPTRTPPPPRHGGPREPDLAEIERRMDHGEGNKVSALRQWVTDLIGMVREAYTAPTPVNIAVERLVEVCRDEDTTPSRLQDAIHALDGVTLCPVRTLGAEEAQALIAAHKRGVMDEESAPEVAAASALHAAITGTPKPEDAEREHKVQVLVHACHLFFSDEIMNPEPGVGNRVVDALRALQSDEKYGPLVIHHERDEAIAYANRLVIERDAAAERVKALEAEVAEANALNERAGKSLKGCIEMEAERDALKAKVAEVEAQRDEMQSALHARMADLVADTEKIPGVIALRESKEKAETEVARLTERLRVSGECPACHESPMVRVCAACGHNWNDRVIDDSPEITAMNEGSLSRSPRQPVRLQLVCPAHGVVYTCPCMGPDLPLVRPPEQTATPHLDEAKRLLAPPPTGGAPDPFDLRSALIELVAHIEGRP